jgi:hypothetical protein
MRILAGALTIAILTAVPGVEAQKFEELAVRLVRALDAND